MPEPTQYYLLCYKQRQAKWRSHDECDYIGPWIEGNTATKKTPAEFILYWQGEKKVPTIVSWFMSITAEQYRALNDIL